MTDYFHLALPPKALDQISELGLAHVGDGVFELLVRSYLILHGVETNKTLHRRTVELVTAPAQAGFVDRILPLLTDRELAVYKRGRNAHSHQAPKSATPGQYARATGLETLFGWLWLLGERDRLNQLFHAAMEGSDHAT